MTPAMILTIGLVAATLAVVPAHADDWLNQADIPVTSISLNGANPMTLSVGDTFTDPGATCVTGGESGPATATGTVDTDTEGTYTITYSCYGGTPTTSRTVTVNPVNDPPVITIGNPKPHAGSLGSPPDPSEFDATCTDAQDGELHVTSSFSTDRDADTGEIRIRYVFSCTDSGGLNDTEMITLRYRVHS